MTPKGCAILYVPLRNQRLIRTNYPTSRAYEKEPVRESLSSCEYFARLFEDAPTADYTSYLCVPAAIKFRRVTCGGEKAIREYCERLAVDGGNRLARILRTEVLPELTEQTRRCCFVNVRLPLKLSHIRGVREGEKDKEEDGKRIAEWIQDKIPQEYDSFVPIRFYEGNIWARFSGQVYLTIEDFEWAGKMLQELCNRARGGEWSSGKGGAKAPRLTIDDLTL